MPVCTFIRRMLTRAVYRRSRTTRTMPMLLQRLLKMSLSQRYVSVDVCSIFLADLWFGLYRPLQSWSSGIATRHFVRVQYVPRSTPYPITFANTSSIAMRHDQVPAVAVGAHAAHATPDVWRDRYLPRSLQGLRHLGRLAQRSEAGSR